MASFLYYCVEVNWMKWLKKYWWYFVISFSSSFVGGIICITITNKNIGSLADWVSGIGSLIAIAFAYWQIAEQRKEYEEDKRQLKLSKRPLFEIYTSNILNNSNETFFLAAEQIKKEKSNRYFTFVDNSNQFLLLNDENYKFFYCIKNVANYAAINPTLAITYKYTNSEWKDTIHADTIVQSGKEAKFLTNVVIGDKKINPDKKIDLNRADKEIELYFMSSDGYYYKQKFKQRKEMIFLNDDTVPDQTTYESENIEEIKKNEFPKYPTAIEMKVVDKNGDYPEIVPINKLNNWYI